MAAAEMCISGGVGLRLDLTAMGDMCMERKLFSESNTRWLAEVSEKDAKEFESIMGPDAICIGITGGDRFIVNDSKIDLSLDEISRVWNEPMWNLMGGGYQ